MCPDAAAPGESGGIQDFIRGRQVDLLERALASLRECPDAELVALTHRLSGTLGTYQLTEAAQAVRDLYDLARSGPIPPLDAQRDETMTALVRSLDDRRAEAGGATTP
jgi:hypothetical protein